MGFQWMFMLHGKKNLDVTFPSIVLNLSANLEYLLCAVSLHVQLCGDEISASSRPARCSQEAYSAR